MTTRFLHHYHPKMGKHYGHTCHIARMNPNHPFLRQGKILYYRPDSAYDSDNPLDESDFSHSSDNDSDHMTEDKPDNKITFVMSKINSQSPSSLRNSSSTSSKFLHDNLTSEDRTPTKLTTNGKPSTTIHILECKDDGTNHVILESRSSPTNITLKTSKVIEEETVHTKLATPAVPMVMDIEDKKEPKLPRMDWNEYHRLATIHTFMDDLEYNYPSICTTGAIGKSLEGRDLKILKISNTDSSNACVWIDAGIHAREWIAPAVATYIANHIATNFNQLPNSVTNKDWYILPVMNPDGYEYTHTKDRMWRKNRAWHSGQCVGVDLNRNFSYGWGGQGSSREPTNAFYRGPEPFSEPESTAVRDILLNSGLSFKVYITLHSYGQVIIFPFAFKDELCPDYVRLLEGATVMSKAIYETNGNTYKVGISRDVMYGAAGTSNDFSYGQAGIPYCYLIELRSKKHKFKLPKEEIEETGNEILNCVKALVEFLDNPVKVVA